MKLQELMRKRSEKDINASSKEAFKKYDILKKKHVLDLTAWKYKLRNKYNPLSTIKVNMQLTNGEVMPFVVSVKNSGFVFNEGYYIVDEKCKYYDNNSNLWTFDYHEELCFPIEKNVKIGKIKDEIYSSNSVELETAINPKSLQKFMESTVIQKLLAGAEMEDSMRKIKVMNILILVVTAITMIVTINMSGLLG